MDWYFVAGAAGERESRTSVLVSGLRRDLIDGHPAMGQMDMPLATNFDY